MDRERTLRAQGAWSELVELLQERVQYLDEPSERQSVLLEVSELYFAQLHDHERAYTIAQAGFKEDDSNDAMARQIASIAEHEHHREELLLEFSQVVIGLERKSPMDAANLWVRMARWYGEHPRFLDDAIHSCEQALRVSPGHHTAQTELHRFAQRRSASVD